MQRPVQGGSVSEGRHELRVHDVANDDGAGVVGSGKPRFGLWTMLAAGHKYIQQYVGIDGGYHLPRICSM